jgi:hypothetical protein
MPVQSISMVSRLIYREEQSFRQSIIPWLAFAAMLFVIGRFGVDFYQQLNLGRLYSGGQGSSNGLIWSSIISFVVMSTLFIILLNGSLVTEIWSDGVRYKFPPLIRKMRYIPLDEIVDVEVAKYKPVVEFGGWGWRRRMFKRKTAFIVSGRIGVRVTLKKGNQILFGTRQQEEMKRAVEKMLKSNT